jgi:phosphohistidine phosphatase
MACEGTNWADIAPGKCTLTTFVRPRDLDAGLGPDTD